MVESNYFYDSLIHIFINENHASTTDHFRPDFTRHISHHHQFWQHPRWLFSKNDLRGLFHGGSFLALVVSCRLHLRHKRRCSADYRHDVGRLHHRFCAKPLRSFSHPAHPCLSLYFRPNLPQPKCFYAISMARLPLHRRRKNGVFVAQYCVYFTDFSRRILPRCAHFMPVHKRLFC
jgi:hypothetical protein